MFTEGADIDDHLPVQLGMQQFGSDVFIDGSVGQQDNHGGVLLFGDFLNLHGGAKIGDFPVVVTIAHIPDYVGVGQGFGNGLPYLPCAIRPNEQDSGFMHKTADVLIVERTPAEAEQKAQAEKQQQCLTIETPVLERIKRGSGSDGAKEASYKNPAGGVLEVLSPNVIGIQHIKEEKVGGDGKQRRPCVVVQNGKIRGQHDPAGNAERRKDADGIQNFKQPFAITADKQGKPPVSPR